MSRPVDLTGRKFGRLIAIEVDASGRLGRGQQARSGRAAGIRSPTAEDSVRQNWHANERFDLSGNACRRPFFGRGVLTGPKDFAGLAR